MIDKSTHYDTLQVSERADREIIEAAYRRLARMRHPDVNKSPAAHAEMSAINAAYDVLKDPAKRARYDIELSYRRRKRAQAANAPAPSRRKSSNQSQPPKYAQPTRPPQKPQPPTNSRPRPRRRNKPQAPKPPPISATLKGLSYIPALMRAAGCGAIAAALTAALTISLNDVQWGTLIAAIIAIAMNGCMLAALCYMCATGPFSIWARPAARAALIAAAAALIAIAAIAIAAQWLYASQTGSDASSTLIIANFAVGFGVGCASRLYQAR